MNVSIFERVLSSSSYNFGTFHTVSLVFRSRSQIFIAKYPLAMYLILKLKYNSISFDESEKPTFYLRLWFPLGRAMLWDGGGVSALLLTCLVVKQATSLQGHSFFICD